MIGRSAGALVTAALVAFSLALMALGVSFPLGVTSTAFATLMLGAGHMRGPIPEGTVVPTTDG